MVEIKEFQVAKCVDGNWAVIISSDLKHYKWHLVYKSGGQVFEPEDYGWECIDEIYELSSDLHTNAKYFAIKFLINPRLFIKKYKLIYKRDKANAELEATHGTT